MKNQLILALVMVLFICSGCTSKTIQSDNKTKASIERFDRQNNEENIESSVLAQKEVTKPITDIVTKEDWILYLKQQPLPSVEEILGQNLIVGFDGHEITDEIRTQLQVIKPGGIVLYRRNIRDMEQITRLIDDLQRVAMDSTGTKYFIMIDEEPDGASRIGLLKNCFPLGSPYWKKIDQDVEILSSLGFNTELAPVTDYPFNPNSFVRKRVPMETQQELLEFNQGFIEILHSHNMFATLKHFPGMGAFTTDPHLAIPDQKISEKTFSESIALFQEGINDGADFIMTAHAVYGHIDNKYPATLSRVIITDLLKKQMNFKGLIITDDLSDMALSCNRWSLDELGELSLLAGHHMILYSHKLTRTYDTAQHLLQRSSSDNALLMQIIQNYYEVKAFKLLHHMDQF